MSKMKELPTKDYLLSKFYIKDGLVFWKEVKLSRGRWSKRANNMVNIFCHQLGYLRIIIDGKNYSLSRVIYQMTHGDLTTDYEIDHIDNNKMNNNPNNLRKVSTKLNSRNRPMAASNTSGVQGVCLNVKRRVVNGVEKFIKYYRADWIDQDGKRKCRYFNIEKYGDELAFEMATNLRNLKMQNATENGFTASHGKEQSICLDDIYKYLQDNSIPFCKLVIRRKLKE